MGSRDPSCAGCTTAGRPRRPGRGHVTAHRLLLRGEAVGIFPEGGISQAYDVRALLPGAVALAAATRAPLDRSRSGVRSGS